MTEEIKANRDALVDEIIQSIFDVERKTGVGWSSDEAMSLIVEGAVNQGFALAMEEANKLYKVMTTISYAHSDDCGDSEEDFSENETCECGVVAIRRALKEFKAKAGE